MSSSFKPAATGDRSEFAPGEAEMRLRLVLDHSLDMIAFVRVEPGPVFRVISINERYLEGVGRSGFALTKEDLINKTVDEVLRKIQASPSLTEHVLSKYTEAVRSMLPQRYEEILETTQGRYYGESVLTPGADSSGDCSFILYTSREVTERKLAEKKIQRLNRLFAVSSSINQAIVRIRDTSRLYEQACRIAVEEGLLRMAWVGLLDTTTDTLKPVSSWGFNDGYTDAITISVKDTPEGSGPGGKAFR